jgi:hypothetical protein
VSGAPGKVIREGFLPKTLSEDARRALIHQVFDQTRLRFEADHQSQSITLDIDPAEHTVSFQGCTFNLTSKLITGEASAFSVLFKDQLRRNGIRFRVSAVDSMWRAWGTNPLAF